MNDKDEFLGPHDVSQIAKVSPQTVRLWGNTGKLHAIRTAGGMRLFRRAEVEELVRKRTEARGEER
jgi:DNA-binding transcriptional MerR regulator